MDSRFPVSREEFYNVQMDVKQLHLVQNSHHERLSRLEKRQADDAAIKSVWNSPFPSALSGTPQHGPLQMPPPSEVFDDFEEQGQNLLGSLHLDAEDEPTRRGAASRANSVRFDESALQGSSWAQNGRPSSDFGLVRPGSGMGNMMERSLSHKSDGRHSSAGHSVHSVHSHHSVASGHGSSLGLDTNLATSGSDEESPVVGPEPPPGFFILGSVPSIIRCWLTANFAHDTLLYADVCTGSQKSVLDYSLIKELGLADDMHRDLDGAYRIRLTVYLTEATVAHSNSRGASPAPQMPSLSANFEVIGVDQPENTESTKGIRIFIGSETLREHSADVLFSQNRMTLYGNEREKLSVPFVRPEDHNAFRHIRTLAVLPDKPKLNANARPFVFTEPRQEAAPLESVNGSRPQTAHTNHDDRELVSPTSEMPRAPELGHTAGSESGIEVDRQRKESTWTDRDPREHAATNDASAQTSDESHRREPASGGIWSSWRHGASANGGGEKENAPLSGYQPAGRSRNMKVLKPSGKAGGSSSARTGAAYEPPPSSRASGEHRRKSQPLTDSSSGGALRWKSERSTIGAESKSGSTTPSLRETTRSVSGMPRTSSNPVGGASAFSWMNSSNKPQASAPSD